MMTVVDYGTEFGVWVDPGGNAEVHCFEGEVEVRPTDGDRVAPMRLLADEAAAYSLAQRSDSNGWSRHSAKTERFVRHLPPSGAGSVARWRRMAAAHPRLVHHYTFEGATRAERFRDRRGELHLREVVMSRGSGGRTLGVELRGIDASTRALAFDGASPEGSMLGVGLVSEDMFRAPAEMTVELLLRLELQERRDDRLFGAVATRANRRDCGFFVMAGGDGQLGHLFDGDAPWTEPDGDPVLRPVIGSRGDWFFVAATFRVADGQTLVNSFVANVGRREGSLRRLLNDVPADGRPATGHLAIGCAFDNDLAHAYPWQGALDEIAIYDTVLDEGQLNRHFQAIIGGQTP
jgi:hypothetical protein